VARRVVCGTNQRQMHMGMMTYASDWNQWLPSDQDALLANRFSLDAYDEYVPHLGIEEPGNAVVEVFICANADPEYQPRFTNRNRRSTTYTVIAGWGSGGSENRFDNEIDWGYRGDMTNPDRSDAPPMPNLSWIGTHPNYPDLSSPARQPLIGEQWAGHGWMRLAGLGGDLGDYRINHFEGTNTAFADGHVRWTGGSRALDFENKSQLWNGAAMRW